MRFVYIFAIKLVLTLFCAYIHTQLVSSGDDISAIDPGQIDSFPTTGTTEFLPVELRQYSDPDFFPLIFSNCPVLKKSVSCKQLPAECLKCKFNYSCIYGQQARVNCTVEPSINCEGERTFETTYICSFCYQLPKVYHLCGTNSSCRPQSSYKTECKVRNNTLCLGNRAFSKFQKCNFVSGYRWSTALILSITLGGFGIDRFYLGNWQEGIGKLFSFGGLGVWTLIDVLLIATGYLKPADDESKMSKPWLNHLPVAAYFDQENQTTQLNNTKKNGNHIADIPLDILDDLSIRFVINIPKEERDDLIRILFQIELAHWFYLDFHCTSNPTLTKLGFRDFTRIIFSHVPFLKPYVSQLESIIAHWKGYKCNVPTYGAILLDESMEHVLLVQGYWAKCSWGFPKGKVNADEEPIICAIREVKEETGYDCSSKINEEDCIEMEHRVSTKLYIVTGVNKDYEFKPITRNEIKNIRWFRIDDLPENKLDMTPKEKLNLNPNNFFMVIPFMKPLKKWIAEKRIKAGQKVQITQKRSLKQNQNQQDAKNRRNQKGNAKKASNSVMTGKFFVKSWENIRFDWNKIWL